jgi:Icc-related predicted phosphoesterase
VISDIKEFLPETITNLKTFAAWIKAASADLVVVNGDVAYSQNEMESVLRVLGTELTTPILVTSGNKELSRDFDLALTNVAADHPQIINGNRVRSLTVNDITFVTLPGYGRKNYTEPGACLFGQPEIDATGELLKKAAGTRVLVAHASPLQAGAEGIDYMVDGKNVGDPRLAAMLTATGTKFAIVGNIKEAGGRGATVAGKAVKAGEMSGELVLNPGPADATPWSMVDKSVSHGMAGLVTFAGGKASYEIKRVEAPKK